MSPPKYWDKKAAYAVDFNEEREFIKEDLETLTSPNFMRILGLGEARRHG